MDEDDEETENAYESPSKDDRAEPTKDVSMCGQVELGLVRKMLFGGPKLFVAVTEPHPT